MPVNSQVFGDPCPNTHKYVEVHYACAPKSTTTTTKRPLPPWFLQSGADNLWNNPILDDVEEPQEPSEASNIEHKVYSAVPRSSSSTRVTSTASTPGSSLPTLTAEDQGNSRGRKPILVTGIPPSKVRIPDAPPEGSQDELLVRIPITTPKPTTSTRSTTTSKTTSSTTTSSTTTSTFSTTTTMTSKFVKHSGKLCAVLMSPLIVSSRWEESHPVNINFDARNT